MCKIAVAPLVGAWIEIAENATDYQADTVAPLVGAWIEISVFFYLIERYLSLPLWERGLKCRMRSGKLAQKRVAPLVGAWIEILLLPRPRYVIHVAPLVGAWIEIKINS